ncbi:MAG: DNA cytosine methyltransferase [Chroococcidiopsis sp.]
MKLATICTGGGVYEIGAIAAGLEPIWGVEINPRVAEVYKLNYPDSQMVVSDVCNVDWNTLPMPDVLHASPSCRHFSAANNQTEAAEDIAVAKAVGKAIAHFLPQIFSLENVRAYQNSQSWAVILNCLQSLGYSVSYQVHRLKLWGIPQMRRDRFIAIAVLSSRYEVVGSRYNPHLLPTTHYPLPKNPLLLTPNRTRHWYEEIQDLIPTFEPSQLTNTQKNKLNAKTRRAIANGETVLLKRNQIRDYTPAAYESDPYCWSITATLCTDQNQSNRSKFADLVTPDGTFSLNTRALARIQTIPDSYKLSGNIAIDGLVIGDGVPPYFVEQMWGQILKSNDYRLTTNASSSNVLKDTATHINRYPLIVNQKELRSTSDKNVLNCGHFDEQLAELEEVIKKYAGHDVEFYRLGKALLEIKTAKLYKQAGYKGFRAYCSDRFNLSKTYVDNLIRAISVYESVKDKAQNLPLIEAHCRSLAKIKDVEMRSLVLEKVAQKGTITAKAIESEYRDMKMRAIAIKSNPELPHIGEVVRLTTKFKHDCLSYNGYWGIVCGVGEYSISVSVLDQILYNLHPQDFIVIGDVEGASALLSRLHAVSKSPEIDITVRELLKAIATNSYPELTKWQAKYLEFTETELDRLATLDQLESAWDVSS